MEELIAIAEGVGLILQHLVFWFGAGVCFSFGIVAGIWACRVVLVESLQSIDAKAKEVIPPESVSPAESESPQPATVPQASEESLSFGFRLG